jgi:hypothetical protein
MKNKVIFTSKKEVAIFIEDIENTFLDEMMLRFPHIAQDVFKELDNESLKNCRNMSRAFCDFIDNEKFYWIRKIQNYVSMMIFLKQWQKVLRNTPTENIKKIFVTVKQFVEYDCCYYLYRWNLQWSPLHIAAAQGHLELCKYIIEKTNNPNPKKRSGLTAFHMAASSGCQEICELIIEHLEDKNPVDNKGMTPFHIASEKGHFDVCNLIIQNIDNKNPAALDGCTPLHLATDHGHLEIVRLIVKTGVDKSPLFKGKTPLELVRPRSRYRFYPLLIENIPQFWYRFAFDIVITFGLFLRDFLFVFFFWVLILMVVISILLAGGVEKIPQFLAISIITVPGTIALLIVVISWVYLSGCIHKYIKKHNFCFETYFADMYE